MLNARSRLVTLALGVALATTAGIATAAGAQRPPDGTYTYAVTGIPVLTQTTIVVVTKGNVVSTIEDVTVSGVNVVARTDYNAKTLLPQHYALTQGGTTTEIVFSGDSATIPKAAVTKTKMVGTKGLLVTEGLIASYMMLPSIATTAGLPLSQLALNGLRVVGISGAGADDAAPPGVPTGDVESAFTDSAGSRISMWSNPATAVVDQMNLGNATLVLQSRTAATATPTPAPVVTPYPTPSPNFSSRDVSFASSGATLAGTLTVPNGLTGRAPAFVFVHGSGPGTRDGGVAANPTFLDLSNALSNNGVVVLRYDKRGIGASTGVPTEDWQPLGDDVRAAVAFLRQQPNVDPNRIYLLGHSEGGQIVPMIEPSIPGIAGIVLMAGPALPIDRVIDEQTSGKAPAALKKAFASYVGQDPAVAITHVNVPILVLQGGRDGQILPTDLHVLTDAAKAANRNITVDIFPEDDHLFLKLSPQRPNDFSEYEIPAPLDPRVPQAILTWLSR
jgi:dienelactone hydrolase